MINLIVAMMFLSFSGLCFSIYQLLKIYGLIEHKL